VPLPFADGLVLFEAWLGLILISYLASRDDALCRLPDYAAPMCVPVDW
jgi:hypothetical protein